jgi:hypothetical protein
MDELTFDGIQFYINGKPLKDGIPPCGRITASRPMYAERVAKLKTEMDAMEEKYKPIADRLLKEIYERSQTPIKPLSEETAQQITKVFENIRKTMEKDFLLTFPTRKARKHYKPKFTL